ncbi:MAG TPA: nuclear transport factor 2 family protein [Candidatus Aquilonibacter sp.]|nr:nuclear transport factor 2 family protein [Candidatus Aquilonibacter sp.]
MQLCRIGAFILASAALAALPAVALAQTGCTGHASVQHWLDDYQRAFEARNTKAVMALYAPDLVAYDITPPLQYTGMNSYTHDYATYFAAYKGPMHLEFRDCHIAESGDLAVVFYLQRVTATFTNGKPSTIWLRVTTALRRVNGHWLDFHDHVSVPTDFDTGKSLIDLHP